LENVLGETVSRSRKNSFWAFALSVPFALCNQKMNLSYPLSGGGFFEGVGNRVENSFPVEIYSWRVVFFYLRRKFP
jgi:hypothetical protein